MAEFNVDTDTLWEISQLTTQEMKVLLEKLNFRYGANSSGALCMSIALSITTLFASLPRSDHSLAIDAVNDTLSFLKQPWRLSAVQ